MEQKTNDLQKELNKHEKNSKIWGITSIASAFITIIPGTTMDKTPCKIDDVAFTLICCLLSVATVKFLDAIKARDDVYNKMRRNLNKLY